MVKNNGNLLFPRLLLPAPHAGPALCLALLVTGNASCIKPEMAVTPLQKKKEGYGQRSNLLLIDTKPFFSAILSAFPACSGPHEVYKQCGTSCPDTCQNLGQPRRCPTVCRSGCFCRPAYVRSRLGGPCVHRDTCTGKLSRETSVWSLFSRETSVWSLFTG